METLEFRGKTYEVEVLDFPHCWVAITEDVGILGDMSDVAVQKLQYQLAKAIHHDICMWEPRLQHIEDMKRELSTTDYIAIKASEGCDVSEYGDWKAKRQALRNEINRLEGLTDAEYDAEMDEEWSN
jgi:hypothetical protein